MRDAAIAVIREIGVAAGGCNIQFAVNPADGEMLVIEMNPRVSRSSALASKATGFPIARIGTKLAVGYRLDEITNDITKTTPASFEPVLDYVVVKCPRFAFEKFAAADPRLTTQMKSVGESMAIGRTFKEALQKGLRALEIGRTGWVVGATLQDDRLTDDSVDTLRGALRQPTPERIFQVKRALASGLSVAEVYELSRIDPWFLHQMQELIDAERAYAALPAVDAPAIRRMKRLGFSDRQLGALRGEAEHAVRAQRWAAGVRPVYKMVDTCAGEFPSATPYLYSSYDDESEAPPSGRRSVVILGSGPNRIGQGVEFDYCCVRAVMALRERGLETIMINSNPETVSTDFDIVGQAVLRAAHVRGRAGDRGPREAAGGDRPVRRANAAQADAGARGRRHADPRDLARRDRHRRGPPPLRGRRACDGRQSTAQRHGHQRRRGGRDRGAGRLSGARPAVVCARRTRHADRVRRSVAPRILRARGARVGRPPGADRSVPRGRVRGGCRRDLAMASACVIGGVMQHIEDAGIHSGDSACVLPPYIISESDLATMREHTTALAKALGVVGLINVQFAIKDGTVYVLEVNPRASRTIPFVSKAIGQPLASYAARVMLGEPSRRSGSRTRSFRRTCR